MFCINFILVCYINEIVDTEEETNTVPCGFPEYNTGTLTRSQSECVSFVQKSSFAGDFFSTKWKIFLNIFIFCDL